MSPRPLITVETVFSRPTFDASLATEQWFAVGITLKGPDTPQRVFGLDEWRSFYGGASSLSSMDVAVEGFFREGGRVLVGQRRLGPAPVKATLSLSNAVPAAVLRVDALYFGAFANTVTVQVVAGSAGGSVVIVIADATGELERSPDLPDQPSAVAWGLTAKNVRVTALAGTGLPVVSAAAPLAGGTDDAANVNATTDAAALAKIDRRYGPGQVSMPGVTTPAAHAAIDAHCIALDRIAVKDFADSIATTVASAGLTERPLAGSVLSGAFAPWLTDPNGRVSPPSAAVAARIAVIDRSPGGTNQPAAGDFGQLQWFTGVTRDFIDTDLDTLANAGVNAIRNVDLQGTLQISDWQTLADPLVSPLQVALSNVRLDMQVRWGIRRIARSGQFSDLDPKLKNVAIFGGLVDQFIARLPGVWGYKVNVLGVNNAATAAAQKLNIRVDLQRDQYARSVSIQLAIHGLGEVL